MKLKLVNNNNYYHPKQSQYFRALEKKRVEWQTKLDKAKFNFVVDKMIGNRYNFIRNYSVFSSDKYSPFKSNHTARQVLNMSNDGIRSTIVSKLEKDNPMKYRRKCFDRDSFASIYQKKQSVSSLMYIHNSNRCYKAEVQNGDNEKGMSDIQQIIPYDNYNSIHRDVLPSIDDYRQPPPKYFNLSISKSNLSL